MKIPSILFVGSIILNLGLATTFLWRTPSRDTARVSTSSTSPDNGDNPQADLEANAARDTDLERASRHTAPPSSRPATSVTESPTWTRLYDDDLAVFEKNLRSAGLPDHYITALLGAAARERVRSRQAGAMSSASSQSSATSVTGRTSVSTFSTGTAPVIAGLTSAQDPFGRRLEFIDASRREQARMIARDYDAMIAQVRNPGGTLLTDSEKEMIATLESERRRDLEALLTPREVADFEMIKSPLLMSLAMRTSELRPTADEFRAIFASESAYASRYGTGVSGSLPPRTDEKAAAAQYRLTLDQHLANQLGEARFAEYDRSRTYEYRELNQLVRRVNLPTTTAAEVFAMRAQVSTESNRILQDASLSADQKRGALQTLATTTRDQIRQRLGNEAGTTYLRLADRWLVPVEQGAAVTFLSSEQTRFQYVGSPRGPR